MSWLTIRQRLTLLFTLGFIATGVVVRAIVFWRLDRLLSAPQEPLGPEDLGLPEGTPLRDPSEVILPDGRSVRDIVGAARMEFRDETLAELELWSWLAILIVAVFAAALGWWLSGRALEPIDRITRTAQKVSAQSLDQRVDYAGPDDEVADLAHTIDGMLERIENGVAAQRQFAAMASHELKTPLAVIDVEADMALSDPTSTTLEELARRTRAAAERATKLVEQLLQLSRSQVGVQNRVSVDLAAIVDEALIAHLEASEERDLRIDFEPGASASIAGDEALLRALIDNLLDNAIKHNDDHGFVSVSIGRPNGSIGVVIENSGSEIDAATLERIRVPFQRSVENPENLGHGIGMTIIRTIVDRHGGDLHLSARSQGGMRVEVSLPTS